MSRMPLTPPPLTLPPLGLGTAGIGNLHRPVTDGEAEALLLAAWEAGIRYFDTAPFYGLGRAEARLGRFLGGLPGPALVSTKVGRVLDPVAAGDIPDVGFVDPWPFSPRFDYGRDGILRSVEDSAGRLGRLPDVLLIHDIGARTHGEAGNAAHLASLRAGGLRALEELRGQGVRGVGIGVNEVEIGLLLLEEVRLDAILLAGRHTLLDRSGERLLRRAQEAGTAVIAGSILNSGILATGAVDGARFDYAPASADVLGRVAALEEVARRHRVPLSAMAFQFPARDSAVTTLLLGASSTQELAASLADLAREVPAGAWDEAGAVAPA